MTKPQSENGQRCLYTWPKESRLINGEYIFSKTYSYASQVCENRGVADLRSFVIVVGFSQAVTSIPQTRDEVKETMF